MFIVLVFCLNFLIFDESMNDLDLDIIEVFEDMFLNFDGCVFIVSYDR